MIRFLQWLFYGHVHKWKIINQNKVYLKFIDNEEEAVFMRYILQCETCGEMKIFDGR